MDTAKANIVFDGNSITYGAYGGPVTQNISVFIKGKMLPHCQYLKVQSFGVTGQTLVSMLADQTIQILSKIKGGDTINILIFNEDINGIFNNGFTKEYNYDLIAQYATNAKNAGFDYVIYWNTPYPRHTTPLKWSNPAWTIAQSNTQDSLFIMLNTTYPAGVDLVVDARLSPIMGGPRTTKINKVVNYDAVHDTRVGYDSLGAFIYRKGILEIFNE